MNQAPNNTAAVSPISRQGKVSNAEIPWRKPGTCATVLESTAPADNTAPVRMTDESPSVIYMSRSLY